VSARVEPGPGVARRAVASAAAVALLAALAACGGSAPAPARPRALLVPALDGGELDLATLRGRVVVLHVFDTGVAATIPDTAQLAALHAAEPRRVAVVGIALDPAGYAVVAPWRKALALRYLIGLATPAVRDGASDLGPIRVVPTTILLDRAGAEIARIERPLADDELAARIAPLLR
jgi:hypothetical protein